VTGAGKIGQRVRVETTLEPAEQRIASRDLPRPPRARSPSPGRCPVPPFEGVDERAGLRIAEQPGDLLRRHPVLRQVTGGKLLPQPLQDFAEGRPFLRQVPGDPRLPGAPASRYAWRRPRGPSEMCISRARRKADGVHVCPDAGDDLATEPPSLTSAYTDFELRALIDAARRRPTVKRETKETVAAVVALKQAIHS